MFTLAPEAPHRPDHPYQSAGRRGRNPYWSRCENVRGDRTVAHAKPQRMLPLAGRRSRDVANLLSGSQAALRGHRGAGADDDDGISQDRRLLLTSDPTRAHG